MQERLINIVEGVLLFLTMANFVLAGYIMIALGNLH